MKASPFNIWFLLISMIFTGTLQFTANAGEYLYADYFVASLESGSEIDVPVYAHFDAWVQGWDLVITLPDGLSITSADPGPGMSIPYIDAEGIETYLTPSLIATEHGYSCHINTAGYWYPDWDEDQLISYGSVKWEPGEYEMFTLHLRIDDFFNGGEIIFETTTSSENDAREDVIITQGETVTYYSGVDIQKPDAPVLIYSKIGFNQWELLIQSVEGASIRSDIYVDDILVAQDVNLYIFDTSNFTFGGHMCFVQAAAEVNGRLSDYSTASFYFYLEKPTSHRPTYRVDITDTEAIVKWTGYGDGELYTYVNGERSVNPYSCQRQESEQQISISATIQNTESYNGSSYANEIIIPPLGVNVAQTPMFKWNPKTRTVTAISEGNQVTMRIEVNNGEPHNPITGESSITYTLQPTEIISSMTFIAYAYADGKITSPNAEFAVDASHSDIVSLSIGFPDIVNPRDYADMKLQIKNSENGLSHSCIITNNDTYRFNVATNTIWDITLFNKYGDILGHIDNVEVAKDNVIVSFTSLEKPQTVTMTVMTPHGQNVTDHAMIDWMNENGEILVQGHQIPYLLEGSKISYNIRMSPELSMMYVIPGETTYTVKDGTNNIVCQLTEILQTQLSGKVKEAMTNQPLYGASVSATQVFAGGNTKTLTATTDNQGVYSVDGMSVPTTMTFAAQGYISQTLNCDTLMTGGSIVTVPDVTLQPITGAVVNINLTYTPAHAEDEVPEVQNWYNDYNNVDYEVYNKTMNHAITNIIVQYPQIVLMEDVNDGDVLELTASSRKNAFNPVKTAVTIEGQKASATFNIMELGKVAASFRENTNSAVVGMLYDSDRKLVKTADYTDDSLTIDDVKDGNYRLITMGKSELFNSIYDLDQFATAGLTEGEDYVKNDVQVGSGLINKVNIDEVPFFNESKLYYTGKSTSFMVNKPIIVIGNYLTLRASIDFKDQFKDKVNDVHLIVDLPENCPFYENSVMVGASFGAYTIDGNRVTIPLANYNDIVRFCAIPTVVGDFTLSAFVQFGLNGKTITQPIGNANFTANALSISVPSTVAKTTIPVSGTVIGQCSVDIYDNDVLVGQTTSLANGSWSTNCELFKPFNLSKHVIYAIATTKNGFELRTETARCFYNKNAIEVSKVKMYHNNPELGETYKLTFDYQNPTDKNESYVYYIYNRKFTFTIEFTSNDTTKISNVVLYVKTANSGWWPLDAHYDGTIGFWIAEGEFGNMYDGDLPVNVAVDFNLNADVLIDSEEIEQIVESDNATTFRAELIALDVLFDSFDETDEESDEADEMIDLLVESIQNELGFSSEDTDYSDLSDEELISSIEQSISSLSSYDFSDYAFPTSSDDPESYQIGNYIITSKSTNGYTPETLEPNGFKRIPTSNGNFIYHFHDLYTSTYVDLVSKIYVCIQRIDIPINSSLISTGSDEAEFLWNWESLLLEKELLDQAIKEAEDKSNSATSEWKKARKMYKQAKHRGNKTAKRKWMAAKKVAHKTMKGASKNAKYLKYLKPVSKAAPLLDVGINVWQGYDKIQRINSLLNDIPTNCSDQGAINNAAKISVDAASLKWDVYAYYTTNTVASHGASALVAAFGVACPPSLIISVPAVVIGQYKADQWFDTNFENNLGRLDRELESVKKHCNPNKPKVPKTDPKGHKYNGADKTFEIDPSGFVYEGVPSNRLQGVTATCYYKETVEDMYGDQHEEVVLWDAEQYGQENPLLTDENGYYRWDVPIGMWQVKYEKGGYETTYSDWLPVPPPQLDVNIGMVQMRQPEVMKAHAYPKSVELEFDKFMIPETLTTDNISVIVNGSAVSGSIELLNAEKDDPLAITSIRRAPGTGLTFASRVRFNADQPFNADHVTLHVNREVESYAGLEMNDDYEVVLDIELEMQEIVADSVVVVPYLNSKQLTVAVLPSAASAGKVINVVSTSPMIASIDAEQYTLDNNGEAVITVHGDLPGMTSLLYSIDGYDLTASTLIDVKMDSELTVATPTASIASGSEVEKGTEVYLYCKTPGATIYYTLDGSCPCDPTQARMVYDGNPIIINSTVNIKAMATAPDLYDSDVATFVYRVRSGLKGDVNNDGEVNIADVNAVIDVILGGAISRADVNGDGEVNIADVNAVIDIILSPANKMRRQVNCEDLLHVNGVTMKPGDVRTFDVTVDHAERYSALQCDIVLPKGLTLVGVNGTNGNESRINEVGGEISRALTYSASKRPFTGVSVPALSISVCADGTLAAESRITLTNVVLADVDNVAWHVADCVAGVNNASGIHDLSVGNHDRVWVEGHALCIETRHEGLAHVTAVNGIVHDVAVAQGVNRHEFEPGIYVVVLNGESYKIVVK